MYGWKTGGIPHQPSTTEEAKMKKATGRPLVERTEAHEGVDDGDDRSNIRDA